MCRRDRVELEGERDVCGLKKETERRQGKMAVVGAMSWKSPLV
jgi:hypothetical protein